MNEARPKGVTPTGQRRHNILKPYTDMLERASDVDEVKPVNIIVITDGAPTDDPESSIVQAVQAVKKLGRSTPRFTEEVPVRRMNAGRWGLKEETQATLMPMVEERWVLSV